MKPEQNATVASAPPRSKVTRILASVAIGVIASITLGVLVFVLGPKTDVVTAYLAPGIVIGGWLSPFIPTPLTYWLVPEGGPDAFLLIVFVFSFFFWSVTFTIAHRYLDRRKVGHARKQRPEPSLRGES